MGRYGVLCGHKGIKYLYEYNLSCSGSEETNLIWLFKRRNWVEKLFLYNVYIFALLDKQKRGHFK